MTTLAIIERQMAANQRRQAEEKAVKPSAAQPLAEALQAELDKAAQRAVAAHQEAQPPRPVLPPSDVRIAALERRLAALETHPMPASNGETPTLQIERASDGMIRAIGIGRHHWQVRRDAFGNMVQWVPDALAPRGRAQRPAPINRPRP